MAAVLFRVCRIVSPANIVDLKRGVDAHNMSSSQGIIRDKFYREMAGLDMMTHASWRQSVESSV